MIMQRSFVRERSLTKEETRGPGLFFAMWMLQGYFELP
jgi:hypothetical protein